MNLHRYEKKNYLFKNQMLTHPNIWELKGSTPGARLSRNFPRRNVNLFHRYSYLRTQIAKWIIVILVKQGLILSGGWYVTTPFSFFFLPLLYHQLCPASSFSCAANYFFSDWPLPLFSFKRKDTKNKSLKNGLIMSVWNNLVYTTPIE